MLKRAIRNVVERAGYTIEKRTGASEGPIIPHGVVEDDFREMYRRCRPYTMTTALEMYNLWNAMGHLVRRGVPGDFVECGVWRGGSAMIAALTLLAEGDRERRLYLYDTYEGMPAPTAEDVTHHDQQAETIRERLNDEQGRWLYASLDEVRANVLSTGFPEERLVMVQGKVEDTIPGTLPDTVAMLRLDTDFYESTHHELVHLFPRLSSGGVLIIDDYDYWKGSRRATDRYLEENGIDMLLQRMDVGRMGVKA